MREVGRLNTVVLHAYVAEPGREQLFKIENRLKASGYKHPLQMVLAHGGLTNIRYPRLYEASFSGPIGGLMGARYLSQHMGIDNWVCTDMGGTSFDVGLIRGGQPLIEREVVINRRIYNIPTLQMDTIGAGTGMYVTIDPITKRINIGPESAGADPGPVCYEMGNEIPTVMDCVLIMGILNPDNYLGGKKKLNKEKAFKAVKEKCADVLGVDPYYFADGVYKLINSRMKEHIRSVLLRPRLLAGGLSPPVLRRRRPHASRRIHRRPAVPRRGHHALGRRILLLRLCCGGHQPPLPEVQPRFSFLRERTAPTRLLMGQLLLNVGWDELEKQAAADFAAEGLPWEQAKVQQIAYVRYGGQMEDLEVISPVPRINSPEDMDKLLAAFEKLYEKVYAGVAKHERAGFQIMELGVTASIPKVKPKLVKRPLEGKSRLARRPSRARGRSTTTASGARPPSTTWTG